MHQIAPNIFIDTNALGLVTAIIRGEHGSLLLDPPLRADAAQSWRGGTARLVIGEARWLVLMDNNFDRQQSAKGFEGIIITRGPCEGLLKSRSASQRLAEEAAALADASENPSLSSQGSLPEIFFSDQLEVDLDQTTVKLEKHGGVNPTGLWAVCPKEKIVFVGDSVLVGQPPFLAFADLALWQEDLQLLAGRAYRGYQIVSSRSGLVTAEDASRMADTLKTIQQLLEPLRQSSAALDAYLAVIPQILALYPAETSEQEQHLNRLQWGLTMYHDQNRC